MRFTSLMTALCLMTSLLTGCNFPKEKEVRSKEAPASSKLHHQQKEREVPPTPAAKESPSFLYFTHDGQEYKVQIP